METPREWARSHDREEMSEEMGGHHPSAEAPEAPSSDSQSPTEPFPCPACGQMLAASCRVCVACRHIIDPAEISRPPAPVVSPTPVRVEEAQPQPVRFPWRLFFAVLGISFLLAQIFLELWGAQRAQLAMGGVQTMAGIWAFFDALRRRIPRPLRWGLGSMLLPVIVFPWYLARRRLPQSPCPFVEAEVRPLTRFLFFALIAFFLLSVILYFVQGPAPH
jgi:hypothetical protein